MPRHRGPDLRGDGHGHNPKAQVRPSTGLPGCRPTGRRTATGGDHRRSHPECRNRPRPAMAEPGQPGSGSPPSIPTIRDDTTTPGRCRRPPVLRVVHLGAATDPRRGLPPGPSVALAFLAGRRGRGLRHRCSAVEFGRQQFTGVAGVVAARLRDALGLGRHAGRAAGCSLSHPALLPTATSAAASGSVTAWSSASGGTRRPRRTAAWPAMLDADHLGRSTPWAAVDRRLRCEAVSDDEPGWWSRW